MVKIREKETEYIKERITVPHGEIESFSVDQLLRMMRKQMKFFGDSGRVKEIYEKSLEIETSDEIKKFREVNEETKEELIKSSDNHKLEKEDINLKYRSKSE